VSVAEHKEKSKKSAGCFVVTVSDTRDETTDQSGQLIKELLAEKGQRLAGYRIVKDEPVQIDGLNVEGVPPPKKTLFKLLPLQASVRAWNSISFSRAPVYSISGIFGTTCELKSQ